MIILKSVDAEKKWFLLTGFLGALGARKAVDSHGTEINILIPEGKVSL